MKNVILFSAILFGLSIFMGCDKKDDTPQKVTLDGTWNLKNIRGGFAGVDDDFELGLVTWTFDEPSSTLAVVNNSTQEFIYSGYETGTYTYIIFSYSNGNKFMIINGTEHGKFIIQENLLTINENELQSGPAADGFVFEFIK